MSDAARRPILLLANPASGGKPGAPPPLSDDPDALRPDALAAALVARGLRVSLHVLDEDDDPAELARRAVGEGSDVVVAGGDGTVGPVAEALCNQEDATLGILGLGSWNNIAHGFGLPSTLDEALDVIAAGGVARLDAGLAWHVPADEVERLDAGQVPPPDAARFFEAAGVGLDAEGFGAVQLGGRRGPWSAAHSLWRALRRRRTGMVVELDGRRHRVTAPAITICNGPYLGMGFAVAPDADPADGRLDVVVFERMGTLEVVRHFLAVARRRRRREPRVRHLRAQRVTVAGRRRTLPAHADGRSIGATPVRFAVDPGALRVFRGAGGVAPDRGGMG
ncbi:MAG TPA: diacylglycerol kinase family protein [Candidatus Limnocylindria bacterium]